MSPLKRSTSQLVLASVIGFSVVVVTACSRRQQGSSVDTSSQRIESSKPPFSTREPERYTAVRVVTSEENFPDARPANVQTFTFKIFREGAQRREESQSTGGVRLIYLENDKGFFVLAPDLKLFADISGGSSTPPSEFEMTRLETSPLIEPWTGPIYQDLGLERRSNKNLRKFRVSESSRLRGTALGGETLVWVDEELGLPVRTESVTNEEGVIHKIVNELVDISFNVEAGIFEVPSDYLRIGREEFDARIREH